MLYFFKRVLIAKRILRQVHITLEANVIILPPLDFENRFVIMKLRISELNAYKRPRRNIWGPDNDFDSLGSLRNHKMCNWHTHQPNHRWYQIFNGNLSLKVLNYRKTCNIVCDLNTISQSNVFKGTCSESIDFFFKCH